MTSRERAIQAAAAVKAHTPIRALDVPGFIEHMTAEFEAHAEAARAEERERAAAELDAIVAAQTHENREPCEYCMGLSAAAATIRARGAS